MPTVPVTCNNCGSPLEVSETTRFATCGHCGSRLEVKRTASAAYTELLGTIAENTGSMAGHLADLAREQEVERIDREWQNERAKYLNKDGQVTSKAGGLLAAVVGGGFGLFWLTTAANIGAPGPMQFFGVVFVVLAVAGGLWSVVRAGDYDQAEARYRERRDAALNRRPPAG